MSDLSKLKKKRTTVRSALTKLINKIEGTINSETESVDQFETFLKQLIEKEINLHKLNEEIEELLTDDTIAEDVEISEEIKEKIIFWKTKLSSKIKRMNSSSIQADTVSRNVQLIDSETECVNINLPKLHIDKYSGSYSKWLDFYNLFESSIHNNSKLSKVDKFTYLKSYLCGNAAACINGFAISEENYDRALELLKDRFGNKNVLINAHLSDLLNLTPVKDPNDVISLRNLYDNAETQIRSLESLGIKGESYANLLTPILMKLIPSEFVLEFNRTRNDKEFDLNALLEFLNLEIRSRERSFPISNYKPSNQRAFSPQDKMKNKNHPFIRHNILPHKKGNNFSQTFGCLTSVEREQCLFCNKAHKLESCHSFDAKEKREILKKQGRCFLCLMPKHRVAECMKKELCPVCKKPHHISICFRNENKPNAIAGRSETDSVVSAVVKTKTNNVMLQTCSALIDDESEQEIIRLFLDNGSQRSFVLKTTSEKFKFPIVRKENLTICTFGAKETEMKTYNIVKIKLKNRDDPNLCIEIEAVETEHISATHLPTPEKNIDNKFKYLKNVQLADCYEFNNKEISILIGADYYYDVVTGRITRLNKTIVAVETLFGWCLQGRNTNFEETFTMSVMVNESDISEQLREFWNLENLGIEAEETDDNSIYKDIMSEFESGISYQNKRYKVKLPWKPNMKTLLENNEQIAKKRFLRLRSTFKNDPSLLHEYKIIVRNYLSENIIEPVPVGEENLQQNAFYLPHRAVIRTDKSTSKLRIVFDASAHAKGQLSLNDCLYTGLNLLPNLFLLLIKFRTNPIAFVADIKMAFLQIEIDESERDFTRFFWDEDPRNDVEDKKLDIYRMTRVLFGVKSSPFLLSATIKYHLKRYVDKFPLTFKHLSQSLYVDDFVCGEINVEQALTTCNESVNIFKDASMDLRKWRTNSPELGKKLKSLNFNVDEAEESLSAKLIASKVLGIGWDEKTDTFYFDSKNLETFLLKRTNTKRCLLQAAGRLFDPIGFLGPYTIQVKCLIQEIWCLGLDWDDELPKQLELTWNKWCNEIEILKEITIPRYYFKNSLPNEAITIQLHCFSDACKRAYGTVVYLRVELESGNITSSFVSSKSRVAPLKSLSIPRLELLGALLSARISDKIVTALNLPVTRYFWTDSSIACYWIKSDPKKHKVFVKNRIQEIQRYSNPREWHHCTGKDNPADLISRGLSLSELKDNPIWWHGPSWLTLKETAWPLYSEPIDGTEINIDKLEFRKSVAVNTTVENTHTENDLITRYSSFSRLIRITALCLRFINNCKVSPELRSYDYICASEFERATETLVKQVQLTEFRTEIKCLKDGQPIPKNSKISSLNVFLHKNGLLRIGGRLKNSALSEFQKHQILLPKAHHFTDLVIDYYHKKSLHSGVQTTLALIRQLYWIPSGQDRVRRLLNKCITCFRTRNQTINQMMGDLPRHRVIPSRPFEKVGLDYAGPIITRPNLKRSKVTLKSYIAIFICFCTKATHLEVVSNLTTEAFLASLRRFISRRSKPSVIWSDNATNFKGARNILNAWNELCKSNTIQQFSAEEGIQWNFIPPVSPHFGGLWEANIKSMKRILLKVTKSAIMNFEELTTLVTQIEAVLNSRPLSPLSSDPNDFQPLTPGHFLTGNAILSFPEPDTASDSLSFHSRWKLIQNLRAKFWSRWNTEYLNHLQTRAKWRVAKPNLKVGQLVILKDPNSKPMDWPLGRIREVFPGHDGLVRVVEVGTSAGVLRRAISRIVPLPCPDDATDKDI